MHGLDTEAAMDRTWPVAEKLRLADDLDNYAEDYSRGMKKKLGLLLAMQHQLRSSGAPERGRPTDWTSNPTHSSTT